MIIKMKKSISALLVLALVLGLGTLGFASSDNAIDIQTAITAPQTTIVQGQTLLLTATSIVTDGNASYVSQTWSSNVSDITLPAGGQHASFVSTANFMSNVTGVFTVTYRITLSRGESLNNTDTDEDSIDITVEEGVLTIHVAPMAAPAVAARILAYNNMKPGYRDGKLTGNFVSDVAGKMGPQTLFEGVEKSILVDGKEVSNPLYRQAVLDFLNSHPKMTKTLVLPPDAFFN